MTNVLDLARQYNEPKKASSHKGGEYHSPCPGCGGTDRFHVWPDQNGGSGSWWCRQCGKGGDAIQFLREFEGMSYPEACDRLGVTPAKKSRYSGPKPGTERNGGKPMWQPDPPNDPPPEVWREKARAFTDWAFDNLMAMEPGEKIKGELAARGINEFVIKMFRLGWNPGKDGGDLFGPRESWGLPTEWKYVQDKKVKKRLWKPRGLVIPLLSADPPVDILRIRFRRGTSKLPYYVLPGSNMDCMVESPDGARAYVIVESELDGMMIFFQAQAAGLPVGVVALGNSSRKPDSKTTAALRSASVILNALDYDKAGAQQNEWWTKHFPRTKRWSVPLGKDPGEAFEQGVDIAEWVKVGLPQGWFL